MKIRDGEIVRKVFDGEKVYERDKGKSMYWCIHQVPRKLDQQENKNVNFIMEIRDRRAHV